MRRFLALGPAALALAALRCSAFDEPTSGAADASTSETSIDVPDAGLDGSLASDPYAVADQYEDGTRLNWNEVEFLARRPNARERTKPGSRVDVVQKQPHTVDA